jgi:hypothetical protein
MFCCVYFFMDMHFSILILVYKQLHSHEYKTIKHLVGTTKEFL